MRNLNELFGQPVYIQGFPEGTSGLKKKKKTRLPMQEMRETRVRSLGQEDPLE